mgnify:CR=1 FL=1
MESSILTVFEKGDSTENVLYGDVSVAALAWLIEKIPLNPMAKTNASITTPNVLKNSFENIFAVIILRRALVNKFNDLTLIDLARIKDGAGTILAGNDSGW